MEKNEGWVCPKCGRGVSPNKDYCECVPAATYPYPYYPYYPWGYYPITPPRKWYIGDPPYTLGGPITITCGSNTTLTTAGISGSTSHWNALPT